MGPVSVQGCDVLVMGISGYGWVNGQGAGVRARVLAFWSGVVRRCEDCDVLVMGISGYGWVTRAQP